MSPAFFSLATEGTSLPLWALVGPLSPLWTGSSFLHLLPARTEAVICGALGKAWLPAAGRELCSHLPSSRAFSISMVFSSFSGRPS